MKGAVVGRRELLGAAAGCLITSGATAASDKAITTAPDLRSIGAWASIKDAPLLAGAGYDFIEEEVGRFLMPDASDSAFEAALESLRQAPIPVRTLVRLLPAPLQSVGPSTTHDAIATYAATVFTRARRAGVETVVFGSPRSRRIPEDFPRATAETQLISLCQRLAPIARANGIILALEPLNRTETNFVNRVSEGAAIVRAVGHPNIRLVADLFHMRMEAEGPDSLVQNGDLLQHVQIAEKQGRRAPGVSGEDFSGYFRALKDSRYDHRLSVECLWSDITREAPIAIRSLRSHLGQPMTAASRK